MDPTRIRAYLQVACAVLGFDIGEVWRISIKDESSAVAIGRDGGDSVMVRALARKETKKHLHFMQLYTSKSFDDRRGELVTPPSEKTCNDGVPTDEDYNSEHNKHVLSPRIVDSISNTAQVIWANCQKTEGFLGRSDMRLLTAVGVPVASDADGNMLVVVMFSPMNLKSSDDAMEYLYSISRCAASTSIPCLLPVMKGQSLLKNGKTKKEIIKVHSEPQYFGAGVTARFVSFHDEDKEVNSTKSTEITITTTAEAKKNRELSAAPTDAFGVPILPQVAEIEAAQTNTPVDHDSEIPLSFGSSDAFDEASYGVWSTIMNSESKNENGTPSGNPVPAVSFPPNSKFQLDSDGMLVHPNSVTPPLSRNSSSSMVSLMNRQILTPQQRERFEEFAAAFLEVSKFDAADVWIPTSGDGFDPLFQVTSVLATDRNEGLNFFKQVSAKSTVEAWSGALGRAYASRNPVWSSNQNAIFDVGRRAGFEAARIRSVLAIPIFSHGIAVPSCIFCCYALVRVDSVPFVLRFVQQALRLLWKGLDHAEPHKSVGNELWRDVAPADLGEMAADTEMQKAFIAKKRPYVSISKEEPNNIDNRGPLVTPPGQKTNLTSQFRNVLLGEASYLADSPKPPVVGLTPEPILSSRTMSLPHEIPQLPFPDSLGSNSSPSVQNHSYKAVQPVESYAERQQMMPSNILVDTSQVLHRTQGQESLRTAVQVQTVPHGTQQPHQQTMPQLAQVVDGSTIQMEHVNHSASLVKPQVPMFVTCGSQEQLQQPQQPLKQSHAVIFASVEPFNVLAKNNASQKNGNIPPVGSTPTQVNWMFPTSSVLGSGAGLANANTTSSEPNVSDTSVSNGHTTLILPCVVNSGVAQYCFPVGGFPGPSGQSCRIQGCNDVAVARRPYCVRHSGSRVCEHPGCPKCAQGSTRFCIAHGGGRRCTKPGCDKGARDKYFCAAHGGGKRCNLDGCAKSAVGGSNLCTSHGGGRRCGVVGCDKAAQSSTKFCVKHGGGKKCAHSGCEKVARGRTLYCAGHGGGVRCKLEGCNRVAIGKMQLCRAHGGGSTLRKPQNSRVLPSATPLSPQKGAAIQSFTLSSIAA